jgi:uncharacterized membrane protein YbhN (UPF0104 family)
MKKVVRIAGCAALLGVLAWRMDYAGLGSAFARLDLAWWLLAVGLYIVAQVVSSERWRRLAVPLGFGGSPLRYVGYYFVGMFFSLALPTSVGGDVARAWYLSTQDGRSPKRSLEAILCIFAERLSGVVMLVVIACVAAPLSPVPLPEWVTASVALIGVATAVGIVVGLWVMARGASSRLPLYSGAEGRMGAFARLRAVIAIYRREPRLMFSTALYSLAVQGLNVVVVAAIGRALGLAVPFEYYAVAVPLITLLTLLPVSVNGMGLREWGYVLFLTKPLGITEANAVGLSVLAFAATSLVPGLLGAGVYLFGRFQRLDSSEDRCDDQSVGSDSDQGRARQHPAAA